MEELRLIVEGSDDRAVLGELCAGKPVVIPKLSSNPDEGGIEWLLPRLPTFLKPGEAKRFGIVVDANGSASDRWRALRHVLVPHFPELKNDLPVGGLVQEFSDKPPLGVWIMPDNQRNGALESFFLDLIPAEDKLLEFATRAIKALPDEFAPQTDAQHSEMLVHTWLAWHRDKPGRRSGQAVRAKRVNRRAPVAVSFLRWIDAILAIPPE